MVGDIWRETIQRLRAHDTSLLRNDITENGTSDGAHLALIQHKFMEYGIYQDCGVGRGYEHGNEGNLEFLDERYRGKEYTRKQKSGKITHGEARQPPWLPFHFFFTNDFIVCACVFQVCLIHKLYSQSSVCSVIYWQCLHICWCPSYWE